MRLAQVVFAALNLRDNISPSTKIVYLFVISGLDAMQPLQHKVHIGWDQCYPPSLFKSSKFSSQTHHLTLTYLQMRHTAGQDSISLHLQGISPGSVAVTAMEDSGFNNTVELSVARLKHNMIWRVHYYNWSQRYLPCCANVNNSPSGLRPRYGMPSVFCHYSLNLTSVAFSFSDYRRFLSVSCFQHRYL